MADREVVGRAKLVKVRVPFGKSRHQWQYDGPGGTIRLWYPNGAPGAVVMDPGFAMDMQTGAVYRDERTKNLRNQQTVASRMRYTFE